GRGRVPRAALVGDSQRECLTPAARSSSVSGLVHYDREQPWAEGLSAPKASEGAVCLEKGVCGNLLGVLGRPRDQKCGSECDCLMHANELLVRGRVAALCPHDEVGLFEWSAHHPAFLPRADARGSARHQVISRSINDCLG